MSLCRCDAHVHPRPRTVAAGRSRLELAGGDFHSFRTAMLSDLSRHPPLQRWSARDRNDKGVMLLELWSYVCAVLSLYDENIAHECYLRTARRAPSLRRLVGLLGYRPRPAVAGSVDLGLLADGRTPVVVPRGTAFQSGAFGDEPPQVFELERDAVLHPLLNEWQILAPRRSTIGIDATALSCNSLLLRPAGVRVEVGEPLLIRIGQSGPGLLRIPTSVESVPGRDGGNYVEVVLDRDITLPGDTALDDIRLMTPTQRAPVWIQTADIDLSHVLAWLGLVRGATTVQPYVYTLDADASAHTATPEALVAEPRAMFMTLDDPGIPHYEVRDLGAHSAILEYDSNERVSNVAGAWSFQREAFVHLDALYRDIEVGDPIVLRRGEALRPFEVKSISQMMTELGEVEQADETIPIPKVPVTLLELDAHVDDASRKAPGDVAVWADISGSELSVLYRFVLAGRVTVEADRAVTRASELRVQRPLEAPRLGEHPDRLLIADLDERGFLEPGSVDFAEALIRLQSSEAWEPPLTPPLTAMANIGQATRGESVVDEILGSGDGASRSQRFQLKNKPLTYLPSTASAESTGVETTLRVWIEGVEWREVKSFFGIGPEERVFTVRQDDDEEAYVLFGDGRRGALLPTGADNVVASYRFGAGSAHPPSGSISQIATPVEGLREVRNPVPASGGADRESPAHLRANAPRAALLLDRAVSLQDFEAAAAVFPGVRSAKADWTWNQRRLSPAVQITCVASPTTRGKLEARLVELSDGETRIVVERALPLVATLEASVQLLPGWRADRVESELMAHLLGSDGVLLVEVLGIGAPLFRSQLVRELQCAAGVAGIEDVRLQDLPFTDWARTPGEGRFFDFENGSLSLHMVEAAPSRNARIRVLEGAAGG